MRAGAALAVGGALLFWAWPEAPRQPEPEHVVDDRVGGADRPPTGLPPAAGVPPPQGAGRVPNRPPGLAAGTPPPGVTAAQWAALVAEHGLRPEGAAEVARLRAYLTWADAVARWRAAPGDAALARAVYDDLPARLAQREVSAPEARVLAAALLQTLEPDPARQATALQTLAQALPPSAAPDPRQQAFLRDQAAVVAAWRAAPPNSRDATALQAQIEALRTRHFAAQGATAPTPDLPPQEASR